MLLLGRGDVERFLDVDTLIDALAPAMEDLTLGSASVPPRTFARAPEGRGILGAMPAYLPSGPILEAKLVAVFPGNAELGLHTHQALIAVFDPETGVPEALMDGAAITALRTAAGSALATRLLAREEAGVLAIVGTGVQAQAHARTIPRVRPISEIRIAGRDPVKARALAEDLADGLPARGADTYEEAIRGADIVCAATHSTEPVVRREWLAAGTHVNSVGFAEGREIDAGTVADAVVVVESRAAALGDYPAGSNDLAWPIRDGLLDPEEVAEVGEILRGTRAGRSSRDQLTLYKSVGVAVQDAAAAKLVLEAARRTGAGTEVPL